MRWTHCRDGDQNIRKVEPGLLDARHSELLFGGCLADWLSFAVFPTLNIGFGDKAIIRPSTFQKWLRAGILEDGGRNSPMTGTGQGSVDFRLADPRPYLPALIKLYYLTLYCFDFGLSAETARRGPGATICRIVRFDMRRSVVGLLSMREGRRNVAFFLP